MPLNAKKPELQVRLLGRELVVVLQVTLSRVEPVELSKYSPLRLAPTREMLSRSTLYKPVLLKVLLSKDESRIRVPRLLVLSKELFAKSLLRIVRLSRKLLRMEKLSAETLSNSGDQSSPLLREVLSSRADCKERLSSLKSPSDKLLRSQLAQVCAVYKLVQFDSGVPT